MASQPQPLTDDPELLRPPLQTRSRESLERVLEAGRELLEEEGLEGFTVQEVSRRAKVSIGSIYARAPSKESLLLAVYDRAVGEIGEVNNSRLADEERWDGMEARELIEEAVKEIGRGLLEYERILRVFMNRAPVDPAIKKRADRAIGELAKRWEELLLRHKKAIRHPDPDLAIEVAFRLAFSTGQRRIMYGPNFGAYQKISDEKLFSELARAVAAYLLEP